MKRTASSLAFLSIVIVWLLAACGGSATPATPPASTTSTPSTSATTASATLKHVPSGMATLNWDSSNHMLTVKITLSGLAPTTDSSHPSTHPAHIHKGSCSSQGGVVYPLQNIVADATGNATVTTMLPNITNGIPASGWYVNVHNGPGLSPGDQFLPIVCGDVANSNTSTSAAQSVQVALTSAPGASTGQAATGKAQLSLSGTTLKVTITLSGLEPNSMHAAHIHKGSCESQGPVVYPLDNVVADGKGNANVATTVNNVSAIPSSGWYVNVHRTIALSTQTGFDPIACGDVILG